MTLCLLGSLLIIFWPMVRRALNGAGLHGLGGAPSPFIYSATHRIMVVWFLGHVSIASILSVIASASGGSPRAQALSLTLQSLFGGGLSLWLIQHWGRRDQDMVPLSIPLRLALGPASGGRIALIGWVTGGLSIGLVLVITGTMVAALTMGEDTSTQAALELFGDNHTLDVRAALATSAVVFAPLFEEILFRGFLYRNLRDVLGVGAAMTVTSLLWLCTSFGSLMNDHFGPGLSIWKPNFRFRYIRPTSTNSS